MSTSPQSSCTRIFGFKRDNTKFSIMWECLRSPPQGKSFEKVKKVEKMWSNSQILNEIGWRLQENMVLNIDTPLLQTKLSVIWDLRWVIGITKLKEPWFVNSDYPFIKKFKQLWNSPHKCVKLSKMKMSRLYYRNEPVRLKNIRLGI